jgi:hypothetical protein
MPHKHTRGNCCTAGRVLAGIGGYCFGLRVEFRMRKIFYGLKRYPPIPAYTRRGRSEGCPRCVAASDAPAEQDTGQQLVNDKRLKLTDLRVAVAIIMSAGGDVPPNFDDLVQASGVDRRSVGLSVIKLVPEAHVHVGRFRVRRNQLGFQWKGLYNMTDNEKMRLLQEAAE